MIPGDWVARRKQVSPDSVALVDAASGRELSYADLDCAVERTASQLAALGIEADDHLGSTLGTRVATVEVVHAAARIGATLVPLDPGHPAEALADRMGRADVTALVCGADAEERTVAAATAVEGADVPVASVDQTEQRSVATLDAGDPASGARTGDGPTSGRGRRGAPDGNGPAMILFTSGTTGEPKAVRLSGDNLLASAVGSAFRIGVSPGDRWLCELPAYHMGGIAPFLRTALYGTTAVVQEREGGFDPRRTLENLHEHDVTGVSLVPTQLEQILEAGDLPDSLRFVLLGGGPAPEELIQRCDRRGVPVHPTYGMTETASQIATARPAEASDHPGTVGRPLVVTEVTVVDDDGAPLGPQEVGEIVVDGPTVTPGYYGGPAATERAFGPHGLHTGDRGYRDEAGRLWVLGRVDDLIVTGGENVDPAVVERAIRSLPSVAEAAVVGIEDPEWGQRVGALVVPADGADPGAGEIREACRDDLASHELPRAVAFADELPRTASGTVERDAARAAIRSQFHHSDR